MIYAYYLFFGFAAGVICGFALRIKIVAEFVAEMLREIATLISQKRLK